MTMYLQYMYGQAISLLEKGHYRRAVSKTERLLQSLERVLQHDSEIDFHAPLYASIAANYLAGNNAEAQRKVSVLESMVKVSGDNSTELDYWKTITENPYMGEAPQAPDKACSQAAQIVYNILLDRKAKFDEIVEKQEQAYQRKQEKAEKKRVKSQYRSHFPDVGKSFRYAKDAAKIALAACIIGIGVYFAKDAYQFVSDTARYSSSSVVWAIDETVNGLEATANGIIDSATWSASGAYGAGIWFVNDVAGSSASWTWNGIKDTGIFLGKTVEDFESLRDQANHYNENTTIFDLNYYNMKKLENNGGLEAMASAIEVSPKSLYCAPLGNEQLSDFFGDGSRAAIYSWLLDLTELGNTTFKEAIFDAPSNHLQIEFYYRGNEGGKNCLINIDQIPADIATTIVEKL
ncbi:MAG TPA: hypothetical protein VJB90_02340 [Candidatus Nanoarchaeia archaeon]|nr:hypothetical protein [Candidatus Nanoarchaeia archaeon]